VNDGEKLMLKKLMISEDVRNAPLPVHTFGEELDLVHAQKLEQI
jgi:hypothetical protein